jgi:hypothetical protein
MGGVKVCLQDSSGKTINSCYSDKDGNFKFSDLDSGTYRLWFDKSSSYDCKYMSWGKQDADSDDSNDSDVNSSGYTPYFTLTAGEDCVKWDAAVTPIAIDLNGDGIHTVARGDAQGSFDLFGNGNAIQSGWLSGDDGFLAIDTNANGRIDSIAELFGGSSKGDGFAKLASFDSNGDGVVNGDDEQFASLKIWQDLNGNHQTDAGELFTLDEAGVSSLTVAYTDLPFLDESGNLHLERSNATLADGSVVDMTDVYFSVAAADAAAAGVELPSMFDLVSSDASLDSLLANLGAPAPAASQAADSGMVIDSVALDVMKQMADLYDQAAA